MEQVFIITLVIVGTLIFISSIDDLLVDVLIAMTRAGRSSHDLPKTGAFKDGAKRYPHIGVFVANWHEEDILERMIEGNLRQIRYRPLRFYLGVYPNDEGTRSAALRLAAKYPRQIEVITNPKNGPTSKGQMLNVMFNEVFTSGNKAPDLAVIHDSEDIIDPLSFDCYAQNARRYDFIQIPVFSLDSRHRSWVGAHYMEEFAERHSREMVLRKILGVMIPSAGVGTCLTRRLIRHFLRTRQSVMVGDCLTEDYVLGAEVHRAGFKATFTRVAYDETPIATREYFPKTIWPAVRQKTRWTYGIAFESTRKLGWAGKPRDKYFFFRDRKGAVMNLLPPVSLLLVMIGFGYGVQPPENTLFAAVWLVCVLNLAAAAIRYGVKLRAFRQVYGFWDALGILARWPLAILINFLAAAFAWRRFLGSAFASRPVAWDKTHHELPETFAAASHAAALSRHVQKQEHTSNNKPQLAA